jgi:hypothetical protein
MGWLRRRAEAKADEQATDVFERLRFKESSEGRATTIEAGLGFIGPPPAESKWGAFFLDSGMAFAQFGTDMGTYTRYTHWDFVESVAIGRPPTSKREVWSFNWAAGYKAELAVEIYHPNGLMVSTDVGQHTYALGLDERSTNAVDRQDSLESLRKHGVKVIEVG